MTLNIQSVMTLGFMWLK